MSLKLYTYQPNYRAWKILIAAAYNDVKIDVVADFKMGEDNKTPEFLLKNPLGKVPVLDTPQGSIFESNAIARYVARIRADTDLYGSSFFESAQVDQWLDACANELEPAGSILLYRHLGLMEVDDEQHNEAIKDVEKVLTIIDNYLLTRTFLVGHKITLADIVVTSALVNLYDKIFDANFRNRFVNLNRWYDTCRHQPNFIKVIGAPSKSTGAGAGAASPKAGAVSSPKAGAQAGKGKDKGGKGKGGDDKAGKEEKEKGKGKGGKGEEKAKEDKPKKDKKKKEEDDDGAEETHEDPKKENPLDALPPSKMNLDATKRLFFEKRPNFDQFFKEFWGFYDAEGFSIHFLDYKFNDDNKVYFMTCNLVTGYIQRLEDLRKYAFGVLNVTGADEDTPPYGISGVFLVRGTGVPAELSECPDTEYYQITKANTDDKAQRKRIEDAFYGNTYQGSAILDRKYFK